MKKKNIIPKIIVIILIIALILTIIFMLNRKQKDMTIQMYQDICEKQTYTFAITEENPDTNYSLTISKNGNSMSIDAKSNDDHTTTLVKDDAAYYIMHLEKEYYLYDSSQIDADILKNELAGIENEDYTSGYEKINGTRYYYEEYDGISTFVIGAYDYDEGELKTRLYFDGDKISYIKNITNENEELLKVEFSDNIDEGLFEIPDDYAEM